MFLKNTISLTFFSVTSGLVLFIRIEHLRLYPGLNSKVATIKSKYSKAILICTVRNQNLN